MSVDYYFAWFICPMSMIAFTVLVWSALKENNMTSKMALMVCAFIWAVVFITTFKIIMLNLNHI